MTCLESKGTIFRLFTLIFIIIHQLPIVPTNNSSSSGNNARKSRRKGSPGNTATALEIIGGLSVTKTKENLLKFGRFSACLFKKSFFPAGKSSGLKVYSGGGGSGTEVDLVEDTALGHPHGGRYRSLLFH